MALRPLYQSFDHTALKSGTTISQIITLCQEAIKFRFPAVCVNPIHVQKAFSLLKGSGVNVATVVGFPLGSSTTKTKVFETIDAIKNGAKEIDMVVCIDAIKEGQWKHVHDDIASVAIACHSRNSVLKVILEMCLLSEEEKKKACQVCVEAGADYVKTSTGFSISGASIEDVRLMSSIVKPHGVKIKAAGGIRTYPMALEMCAAGADRIGASSSVSIMNNHFEYHGKSFFWESGKSIPKEAATEFKKKAPVSQTQTENEGMGPHKKYTLKKEMGTPSWSMKEGQEMSRLAGALEILEKSGVCPVIDGRIASSGAILFEEGYSEGIMVSPTEKKPNKCLFPSDFVHITDFNDTLWCASYKSKGRAKYSRPTRDTPILWAVLIKAWSRFGWEKRPRVVLHGYGIDSLEQAQVLKVPCSEKVTTFSTLEDINALYKLFEKHSYPENRLYIRKGHGFFLMGDSVSDCMSYFNTNVKPFLTRKNTSCKKDDSTNLETAEESFLIGTLYEGRKKQKKKYEVAKDSFIIGSLNAPQKRISRL